MKMDYKIHLTVRVYVDEHMDMGVLKPHNRQYGINGKEIIAPLRKVNGMEYCIRDVSEEFTVEDLWHWIDHKVYGDSMVFSLGKYLVFDNVRYIVEDIKVPLKYYLNRMCFEPENAIDVQILLSENAGDVFRDDGIRYYMHSRESGKHNEPHVHVDVRHEYFGSFSIMDGRKLTDDHIKAKDIKKIQKRIADNREQLIEFWNLHTDGLTVDLNQKWKLIHY